jgi:hypothetical protein
MKKNGTKITVLHPRGQPTGIFGRSLDSDSNLGLILDPHNQPSVTAESLEGLKMAPRLKGLDGKTVYLVETGFAGASEFMEEVQGWFTRNMPAVKTEFRHKKYGWGSHDPEMWVEIKENGDAAIIGVGG